VGYGAAGTVERMSVNTDRIQHGPDRRNLETDVQTEFNMDPIEEIWRRMESRVRRRSPRPTTVAVSRSAFWGSHWSPLVVLHILHPSIRRPCPTGANALSETNSPTMCRTAGVLSKRHER